VTSHKVSGVHKSLIGVSFDPHVLSAQCHRLSCANSHHCITSRASLTTTISLGQHPIAITQSISVRSRGLRGLSTNSLRLKHESTKNTTISQKTTSVKLQKNLLSNFASFLVATGDRLPQVMGSCAPVTSLTNKFGVNLSQILLRCSRSKFLVLLRPPFSCLPPFPLPAFPAAKQLLKSRRLGSLHLVHRAGPSA